MNAGISVLVPSARGGAGLLALAKGFLEARDPQVEVLVADNGLAPGTRAGLRDAGVTVVEMGENAGFGRAVNRLVARAAGAVLIVTNDDIDPAPGFCAALAAPVLAGVEMAAGVLVQAENAELVESAGVVVDRLLGSHDHLHGAPLTALEGEVPAPLGPSGGAAAFARDAFLSVGGYDEGFFAYLEDVDLALRLRRAGAGCELAATARALHWTSGTLGYGSLSKAVTVGRSRGRLMRKYGVLSRPLRGAAALAVEAATSAALAARNRSLAPGRARVEGWRACEVREEFPPRSQITIGVLPGLRRRLARQRRRPPPPGARAGQLPP
jgi:N-acetylglucosaminyl-diphospho-decaprenol L-rhamnosyltransferase